MEQHQLSSLIRHLHLLWLRLKVLQQTPLYMFRHKQILRLNLLLNRSILDRPCLRQRLLQLQLLQNQPHHSLYIMHLNGLLRLLL